MSEPSEMRKEEKHPVRSRLASDFFKKSYHVAQVHPLVSLALLLIAGAAAVPYGKTAHAKHALNAPRVLAAPQSSQPRQNFSLLSTMPAKPARAKSRPAPVPPVPPSPTGPPNAPVLFAPSNGTSGAPVSPPLDVSVTDPAGSNLTVSFYGKVASTIGPDFTVVALPDTQYYSSSLYGGTPAMFNAQTQWIVNNQNSLNIAYVAHLGDMVQNGDNGGEG